MPAYQTGTVLAPGSATSAAISVPTGVAVNDIISVHLYKESTSITVTPPDGTWSELTFSPTPSTTGSVSVQHVFWKRPTAADSGTYTFSFSSSVYRAAICSRWSGCITAGTPMEILGSAARSSNGTTTPGVSGTTVNANGTLVWGATNFSAGTWTPPSGFTERADNNEITLASLDFTTVGAVGPYTGTVTNSGFQTATLISLIAQPAVTSDSLMFFFGAL